MEDSFNAWPEDFATLLLAAKTGLLFGDWHEEARLNPPPSSEFERIMFSYVKDNSEAFPTPTFFADVIELGDVFLSGKKIDTTKLACLKTDNERAGPAVKALVRHVDKHIDDNIEMKKEIARDASMYVLAFASASHVIRCLLEKTDGEGNCLLDPSRRTRARRCYEERIWQPKPPS